MKLSRERAIPLRRAHRVAASPDRRLRGVLRLVARGVPAEVVAAVSEVSVVPTRALASPYRGPLAPFVMAPFATPYPSRLSDGTYGVLYTALDVLTASAEHGFHLARWAASERLRPQNFTRVHAALEVRAHLRDLRRVPGVSDPDDYSVAQRQGAAMYAARAPGAIYRSARAAGTCIGVFAPTVVQHPAIVEQVVYAWDGGTLQALTPLRDIVTKAERRRSGSPDR